MKNILKSNWKLFLIISITLGLAPFNPPHIVGKVEWLMGGQAFSDTSPMQFKDWFDLLLHGLPWVLLLVSATLNLFKSK